MSQILDKLTPGTGSWPGGGGGPSAFDRFLGTLVPGQPPSDEYGRALLYAALGSALTLTASAACALLPEKESILGAGVYAAGRRTLANVMGAASDLALPLAILGGVLLLLTGVVALIGRRGDRISGAVCIASPIVGVGALGGAGLSWLTLLVILAVNLLIWAVVIAFVVIVAFVFLGAIVSG
jgi:hypothetical protein